MIRLTGCTIPTNSPHTGHPPHGIQVHLFGHVAAFLEHQFSHFFAGAGGVVDAPMVGSMVGSLVVAEVAFVVVNTTGVACVAGVTVNNLIDCAFSFRLVTAHDVLKWLHHPLVKNVILRHPGVPSQVL